MENHIAQPWRAAIEEAWIAYCAGSFPVGAAITNAEGRIVATGRNRLLDEASDGGASQLREHFMGHAELHALMAWGRTEPAVPLSRDAYAHHALYTTLEPCAMCTGTLAVSGIKTVRVLVPDPQSGGLAFLNTEPGQRFHITVEGPAPDVLGNSMLGIIVERILALGIPIRPEFEAALPAWAPGFALARALHASGELGRWCAEGVRAMEVMRRLARQLH